MSAPAIDLGVRSAVLSRTRLCKYFVKGRCKRGNTCTWAHGEEELQPRPDLYRTQLCMRFFTMGSCLNGQNCRFAHGCQEMRLMAALPPGSVEEPWLRAALGALSGLHGDGLGLDPGFAAAWQLLAMQQDCTPYACWQGFGLGAGLAGDVSGFGGGLGGELEAAFTATVLETAARAEDDILWRTKLPDFLIHQADGLDKLKGGPRTCPGGGWSRELEDPAAPNGLCPWSDHSPSLTGDLVQRLGPAADLEARLAEKFQLGAPAFVQVPVNFAETPVSFWPSSPLMVPMVAPPLFKA